MDKFCLSRGKWDTKFAEFILNSVVSRWCAATGKDNILLARILLVIGDMFVVLNYMLVAAEGTGIPWSASFGMIFWTLIAWARWAEINKCAKMAASLREGLSSLSLTDYRTASNIIFIRKVWVVVGVLAFPFDLFTAPPFFDIGIFLMGVALYVALAFDKGGTSVWARAKEKVADWVKGLQWQPALQPVSVQMGGRTWSTTRSTRSSCEVKRKDFK